MAKKKLSYSRRPGSRDSEAPDAEMTKGRDSPRKDDEEDPREDTEALTGLEDDVNSLIAMTPEVIESQGVEVPVYDPEIYAENYIGEIVGASVSDGLSVKLIRSPETMRVGTPLMVESEENLYYTLVRNIYYPPNRVAVAFANSPMRGLLPVNAVPGVRGSPFYAIADLNCLQIIEADGTPRPVDTIPPLLARARVAEQADLEQVYQHTETSGIVGHLNGIEELLVPVDFKELVEVPFGVFGSTGWGKSVLMKILASWIVHKRLASLLIFDIQGEYTWRSQEGTTPGLARIFGDELVVTFALDSNQVPRGAEDFFLYKENVKASDLITALLSQKLTTPQINSIYHIYDEVKARRRKGQQVNLIDFIMTMNDATRPEAVHPKSVPALKNRIKRFAKLKFLRTKAASQNNARPRPDSLSRILDLFREGRTAVLNFGKYGTDWTIYMFVANLVVRRIRQEFQRKNMGLDEEAREFQQTVILLEEAHKFLTPSVARYSVFGKIAREMRKYGLTLGLVDQRPSQIWEEVYSQMGNRFILRLTDPKDIDAALSGIAEPQLWQKILRGLEKRTVLGMGTCITVPSIFRTWEFDIDHIKEILALPAVYDEIEDAIDDEDLEGF